jgi:hypothetical protein
MMVPKLSLNGTTEAHSPENIARKIFRESIAEVAATAKESLPESHGRIDKAVRIVLQGDVILFEDGVRFAVGSESDADLYYIIDNECTCPDSDRAPEGYCKHVIATFLYRRGTALAAQRMQEIDVQAIAKQHEIKFLPEAPASANVFLTIQGRKVQLTLRDHNENSLLARMELLLNRFPEESSEPTTPPEGWCPIHQVQMKRYSNQKGTWWSHRLENGKWCRGK